MIWEEVIKKLNEEKYSKVHLERLVQEEKRNQ